MLQAGNRAIFSTDKCVSLLVQSQSDVRGSRLATHDALKSEIVLLCTVQSHTSNTELFPDLFSLGAYTTSLPTMTPSFTLNHVSTKINDTKEPNTGATIRTDVIRPPESMTSTDVTRGIIL